MFSLDQLFLWNGSVMKYFSFFWFAFYSFMSVFRTCCLSDGCRARSPLETIKIFFFFSVRLDKSSLLSILGPTHKQLTGKLRDSDEWPLGKWGSTLGSFQGYWAAWRLKAENYVVFHLSSDQHWDLGLTANVGIYFRGKKRDMFARRKRPKLKCHLFE